MLRVPVSLSTSPSILSISPGYGIGVDTTITDLGFRVLYSTSNPSPTNKVVRFRRTKAKGIIEGVGVYKEIFGLFIVLADENFQIEHPLPATALTIGYKEGNALFIKAGELDFISSDPLNVTHTYTGQYLDTYFVNDSPCTSLVMMPLSNTPMYLSGCFTLEHGYALLVSLGIPSVGRYNVLRFTTQSVTQLSDSYIPGQIFPGNNSPTVTVDVVYSSKLASTIVLADNNFNGGDRYTHDSRQSGLTIMVVLGIP